ncbi:MAG: hypothetical protein IPN76_06755 [Saprospiraceae bacterium]|nr:hypothetical protein [Saprospiraceae bacterium]
MGVEEKRFTIDREMAKGATMVNLSPSVFTRPNPTISDRPVYSFKTILSPMPTPPSALTSSNRASSAFFVCRLRQNLFDANPVMMLTITGIRTVSGMKKRT